MDLHLLRADEIEEVEIVFQGQGENTIEELNYKEKRVYINHSQYFEGIPEPVWQYRIGGYQACEKWLEDRKHRSFSLDEVRHFCRIVSALQKTLEIQKAIDAIYPEIENDTLLFAK